MWSFGCGRLVAKDAELFGLHCLFFCRFRKGLLRTVVRLGKIVLRLRCHIAIVVFVGGVSFRHVRVCFRNICNRYRSMGLGRLHDAFCFLGCSSLFFSGSCSVGRSLSLGLGRGLRLFLLRLLRCVFCRRIFCGFFLPVSGTSSFGFWPVLYGIVFAGRHRKSFGGIVVSCQFGRFRFCVDHFVFRLFVISGVVSLVRSIAR